MDKFRDGHFYLTVKPKLGNIQIIDCGTTEKAVMEQLDLLNDRASLQRQTVIKGFFSYQNSKVTPYKFTFNEKKIIRIEKA